MGQTPLTGAPNPSVPPTRLIVSGNETSESGAFARLIAPSLSSGLGMQSDLDLAFDLGHDGVTAANLFDRNPPEDNREMALVSKGSAVIASLCDDARVHFDYSRWISVLAAQQTVMTIARAELHRSFRARVSGFLHDKPSRVAVAQPIGVELATVLGLSVLGLHPLPVSGIVSPKKALAALANNEVDAIQLTLTHKDDLSILHQLPEGTAPLFYVGADAAGVPSFEETFRQAFSRAPGSALYAGWRALSAAAATPILIALPMLTSPVSVARWRYAIGSVMDNEQVKSWLAAHALHPSTGVAASGVMARFTPELSALLALRRWLNINLPRWRLGQETKRSF
ncbi:Tripartite-type tricarboxylate transporter receptor subunit TctC [Acetobacteraceae bacterium EV16G]|uniref:hypothetical protein n=2 Tax=Sorlinia euscelidii TaxID=3081148 RepID=UPI002F3D9986